MKFLAAILLGLLLAASASAGTFHCQWLFRDAGSNVVAIKEVLITPIAPYGVDSNNIIITGDRKTYRSDSAGSLIVSNLFNGRSYRVQITGPQIQTTFTNSFDTNVTGLVNGADSQYLTAPIRDGSTTAYSRTQTDALLNAKVTTNDTRVITLPNASVGAATTAGTATNATTADGLRHIFYPVNFGAVSTEHFDDSAAIQRCWDAAKTNVQFIVDGQNKIYWLNTNGVSLTATNLAHKGVFRNFYLMTTNHALPFMISNSANMTEIVDNYFGSPNHTNSSGTALKLRHLTDLWGAQDYTEMVWAHRNYFTNFATQIDAMHQDNLIIERNRGYGFRSNGLYMVDCDQVTIADNYFGFSGIPPHLQFETNVLARPDFFYGVGQTNWLYTSIGYNIYGGISTYLERNATYGVGTSLHIEGNPAKPNNFTLINNDFEFAYNTNRGIAILTNYVNATLINNNFIPAPNSGPRIELNNVNIRNCLIVNPPTWISQYPAADPFGSEMWYPRFVGGANTAELVTHSSYNPLSGGTTNSISTGTVPTTLTPATWKSTSTFNSTVNLPLADSGGISFVTGGDAGFNGINTGTGNKTFAWAGKRADNDYFPIMFQQDFSAGSLRHIDWGSDGGVGRNGLTYMDFFFGAYNAAPTRTWRMDTEALWSPTSPEDVGKSASPVGTVWATNFTGRFNFPTNAASVTPNRTLLITNSNGEVFKILAEKL